MQHHTPILNITMMPAPLLPAWNPKDPTAPLKEEYIQLYKDTMTYHHWTDGHLKPLVDLHMQILPLPSLVEIFTDKGVILAHISNLCMHLGKLCYLYGQGQAADASCKLSVESTAKPTTPHLKSALLMTYDRTSSKAWTFLSECCNFMIMNESTFPNDHLHIWWTLQLCTDKATTWKCIQLDLLESGTDVPDYLLDWDAFQEEFLLKWADLNAQNKVQAWLLAGVKQTMSVWCYTKIFKELVLEAKFHDPVVLILMFYEGLKWEVKQHLVGKKQNELTLAELKATTITLDEEHKGAEQCNLKPVTNHSSLIEYHKPNWQLTMQIKAEVACVGMSLSTNNCAQYMHKGHCFGCRKTGDCCPDCLDGKSQAHVTMMELVVDSLEPEAQPKNWVVQRSLLHPQTYYGREPPLL